MDIHVKREKMQFLAMIYVKTLPHNESLQNILGKHWFHFQYEWPDNVSIERIFINPEERLS